MVCPKCVAVGTAGAAIGVAAHNLAVQNGGMLGNIAMRLGPMGTAFICGSGFFLISSVIMSSVGLSIWGFWHDDAQEDGHCHGKLFEGANKYKPFTSKNNTLPIVASKAYMEDMKGDTLLVAADCGSSIFSKDGLNYLVGGKGEDKFFFSMCSTRNQDGKTSVIENFEDHKDKIHLFCTKREITWKDVGFNYDQEQNVTFLHIKDPVVKEIVISVLGNHPNLLDDTYLNCKWETELQGEC